MKRTLKTIAFLLAILFVLVSCNNSKKTEDDTAKNTPLTLEFIESGEISVSYSENYGDSDVYYSLNGGERTLLRNNNPVNVPAGEKVSLYRTLEAEKTEDQYVTIQCTKDCYVYGNVMSLIDSDKYAKLDSVPKYAFSQLFFDNKYIRNHETLELILPATTLAEGCYSDMFESCTSLTEAPVLPALTLADYCYGYMFAGCTSLTKAPKLSAATLVEYCYQGMFAGCNKIREITCLATDVSAPSCTFFWLYGVSEEGTFIKSPEARWPSGDFLGIPEGWAVHRYTITSEKSIADNSKGPAENSFYELVEDDYVLNNVGHLYAGKNPEAYKIFDKHNYVFNNTLEAKKTIIKVANNTNNALIAIAEEDGIDPNYFNLYNLDPSDRELLVLASLILSLFPDEKFEPSLDHFSKYYSRFYDSLEYKTYKPSYSEAIYYFKDEYSLNYYFNDALEDASKYYNKMYSEQSELLDNLKKQYMSVEEYRDTLGSYSIFYIETINRLLSVIDTTSSNKPKDYEYALTIFETNGELSLYLIEYESNTATRISGAQKSTVKNEWLY